jgi:SAM-dependent methyltransferase
MTQPDNPDLHVKQVYSNDYFNGGNTGYPDYLHEGEILIQHGRRYGKIISKFIKKPGKVLDVGTAAGFILKGLVDLGWEGYGVEPNDLMAKHAREMIGLKVQTGTIESFKARIQFDLICFIQVIEHLLEPSQALELTYDMLSSNGLFLVETWNYKSLVARLLGKHWHQYSPPIVLHWFTPDSLNKLMRSHNFKLLATSRPRKYLSGKYAKSILEFNLKNLRFSMPLRFLLNLIPDNLTIRYPGEDMFWSLYQRNA